MNNRSTRNGRNQGEGKRPHPRFFRTVGIFETTAASVLRIAIMVVSLGLFFSVLLQVLNRYAYVPFRTMWTTEVAQYLFVWTSVMGASLSLRENRHVRIGLLVDNLPFALRKIVEVFGNIIIITTSAVLVKGIIDLFPLVNNQISPASKVRMSYVYAAGLLGGILFISFSVTRMLRWLWYGRDDDLLKQDR